MKLLCSYLLALALASEDTKKKYKLDYKDVFIEDPATTTKIDKEKLKSVQNKALLEVNKQWINQHTGKELTKEMLNIPNTMPITPHGVSRYVDDSPYCWVIFAFDSDEDVASEIVDVAKDLTEYFYERCGVGMLDMAYPSNKNTFGYLIEDLPMLLLKHAGRDKHILEKHLEKGGFIMSDIRNWGKRVFTDDLEDDIQGELKKIVDNFYTNGSLKDFTRISSMYMTWYNHDEEKEKGAKIVHDHIVVLAGEMEKNEEGEFQKGDFYARVEQTTGELESLLTEAGLPTKPREIVNRFEQEFTAEKTKYEL